MRYPKGVLNTCNNNVNIVFGNRGMNLEKDINISNKYYIDNNIAFIYKKPTPIKILEVDYPSKNEVVIKRAVFESPSTTDYNGLYKGKYIDFEAKETDNKSNFPLANIHKHQIKHIENMVNNGGICFLIVRFNKLNKTFLLDGKEFISYINDCSRKSIPIEIFESIGYLIEDKYIPRVDYLDIINKIYGGVLDGK